MQTNNELNSSLVCLHGWGVDAHIFSAFLKRFFPDRETRAPEIPAFTSEKQTDRPMTMDSVCQQLDSEITGPSFLMGWSLGGQIAIEFASRHPEKIYKLILLSCSPCFIKKQDWPNGIDETELLTMRKELLQDKDKTLKRFYAQTANGTGREKEKLKTLLELNEHVSYSAQALDEGLSLLLTSDQRQQFQSLSCPIYMCFGMEDSLVNVKLSSDCKTLNPGISTCLVDGGGHAPFLFKEEEIADWIMQIITGRLN